MGGSKPNAMIFCYTPVEFNDIPKTTELGAIVKQLPAELNSIDFVDKNTPPAFIWHTVEDEKVPVSNALRFAAKCLDFMIPFEIHVYEKGQHGLSLNSDLTAYKLDHPGNVETWVPMCIKWLNDLFNF